MAPAAPRPAAPESATAATAPKSQNPTLARSSQTETPPSPGATSGETSSQPISDAIPAPASTLPIDLATALTLAERQTPEIGLARTAVLDSLAQQQQARSLLLPTLNAGTNYHYHDGDLQRSSGRILKLSEQSLYVGGGARTLAAESIAVPAVSIITPLTEVLLEPIAARQRLERSQHLVNATANVTLLDVVLRHLELLSATAKLRALKQSKAELIDLDARVRDFARVGQGCEADADRLDAELELRCGEILAAEGEVAVAAVQLARLLSLDPSIRLAPASDTLEPISIVDANQPIEGLVEYAIRSRPDIAARDANVALAGTKLLGQQKLIE